MAISLFLFFFLFTITQQKRHILARFLLALKCFNLEKKQISNPVYNIKFSATFILIIKDCWRSRDKLVSDVLLWTPEHGRAKAGCPARTYIQQLCADTGCSPEDLPKAMDDREVWRETVRNDDDDGIYSY